MTSRYILLANGTPLECPPLFLWAYWFESDQRHIAFTKVGPTMKVSTIFRGLSDPAAHLFGHPQSFFETIIFGGRAELDNQEHYATMAGAVQGHATMVMRAIAEYQDHGGGGKDPGPFETQWVERDPIPWPARDPWLKPSRMFGREPRPVGRKARRASFANYIKQHRRQVAEVRRAGFETGTFI